MSQTILVIIRSLACCVTVMSSLNAAVADGAAHKSSRPGNQEPLVTVENAPTVVRSFPVPAVAAKGPAAHDPQFTLKAAWPQLTGKEAFASQTWPKGRLLVWAKPGQNAGRRGELSPMDAANWLVDGKPASEVIFDEETDVLIPASDKVYTVNFREMKSIPRQVMRHVTVEANAHFRGGGDGIGRQIHGNVWVKREGMMSAQGATSFVGPKHTFVRNDNVPLVSPGTSLWGKDDQLARYMLSQYFSFGKAKDASVEFLGQILVLDEFMVESGTCIVGENSMLQPGRSANPWVGKDGTIALMDGAFFGNWSNTYEESDLEVRGGSVQGGLPSRPLHRPATLAVHWKNWTKDQYLGGKRDADLPGWFVSPGFYDDSKQGTFQRRPGLRLGQGSTLRSFTTDPAIALLSISEYTPEVGNTYGPPKGAPFGAADPKGKPNEYAALIRIWTWSQNLPRGIDVHCAPGVTIDGISFVGLRPKGLLLAPGLDATSFSKVAIKGVLQKDLSSLITPQVVYQRNGY